MPYKHDDKSSGQLIRSADWNTMGHEIERLEADKVNRAGDTIKGDLTVAGKAQLGPLAVTGDASVSGKAQLGPLTVTGDASVSGKAQFSSLVVTGDASVAGLLLGAKSSYWSHNPYADAIGLPVASVGRLEVGGYDDGSGTVPAIFRIHQCGSGAAEFYKPQGQTLYLRETPGGGGSWFNTLEVSGAIRAGNSDLYFSKTDHDHTGIGNTDGWAAIENAKNYDALIIQGRAHTGGRRVVRLWDYLEVNGDLRVTGQAQLGSLAVAGDASVAGLLIGAKSSYWGHNPYADAIGPPVASIGRLEVGGYNHDGSGTVPAILRIHQWGSGAAEFYKPQGQTLYLRETPGGGGSWFNTLEVNGAIRAGNSDLYFSKTDHDHIGLGNTDGWAAIENARNYDALMILGRAHTGGRRVVKLWDDLDVNGDLRVVGQTQLGSLAVAGDASIAGLLIGAKSSYWGHNPYADAIGPPVASIGRLEVGGYNHDGSGTVPAILRIHQSGSGAAEFYKPQGQTLYLRETPGGGGSWFNTLEVSGALRVTGNTSITGGVLQVGSLQLGGFTGADQDEWPNAVWYRDPGKNWDEGLIKHSSARGKFGRAGFGVHFHQAREFGLWSTGWDPLFAVAGASGDTFIKGNLEVTGTFMEKLDLVDCNNRDDWTAQNHPIVLYFKAKLSDKPIGTMMRVIQNNPRWRGHYWQGWVDADRRIRVIHNYHNTGCVI